MKKIFVKIFYCAALLIFGATAALAEGIIWYQPDFPPYMIVRGPNKDRGIDNRIIGTVCELLPEYEHSYEVANYKRIQDELKKGKHGVITPLFRTPEREKFIVYTNRPSYFVYSNGFIYRKADKHKYAPYILADGTLDLAALCLSNKFTIGINAGRSYYGVIDRSIKKYKVTGTFRERQAIAHSGLFEMISLKRIDAAFGFPVEIKYAGLNDSLGFLKISQMVDLTPVFFGAPKNDFGKEVVNKLNGLLEKESIRQQFVNNYRYWLDKDMVNDYDALCEEHAKQWKE